MKGARIIAGRLLLVVAAAAAGPGGGCAATRAATAPKDVLVTTGDLENAVPVGFVQSDVWRFDVFSIVKGGEIPGKLMQEGVDNLAAYARKLGANSVINVTFWYRPGFFLGRARFAGEAALLRPPPGEADGTALAPESPPEPEPAPTTAPEPAPEPAPTPAPAEGTPPG